MKAKAIAYRGIEFIKFTDLPENQQALLVVASTPERIKILMDGKLLENCIQYREYSEWYHSTYKKPEAPVPVIPAPVKAFLVDMALHKA